MTDTRLPLVVHFSQVIRPLSTNWTHIRLRKLLHLMGLPCSSFGPHYQPGWSQTVMPTHCRPLWGLQVGSVSTYFDALRFYRGAVLSSSLTDSMSNSWIRRCLRTAVFRFLYRGPFQCDPPPHWQLVTGGWKWRKHTWRPIIASVAVTAWQEERCCE